MVAVAGLIEFINVGWIVAWVQEFPDKQPNNVLNINIMMMCPVLPPTGNVQVAWSANQQMPGKKYW